MWVDVFDLAATVVIIGVLCFVAGFIFATTRKPTPKS